MAGDEIKGKKPEKGYEVKDKRIFDADGEVRKEPEPPTAPEEDKKAETEPEPAAGAAGAESMPPMDFGTFLMSIATAALYHLGDAHAEGEKPPEPNLPMARQTINILELLQEKTRGNLTKDEEGFLEGVLFDLRMRYMAKAK
jgi:hypothetical protein